MAYTATTGAVFRKIKGSLSQKLGSEFGNVQAGLDAAKLQRIDLSAGIGTATAIATAGIDIATGSNATYYGVFVADRPITVQKYLIYFTEAYVKLTTDAKVEIKNEAGTPAVKATYTCTATGEAAKSYVEVSPATGQAALAKGEALDIAITATASATGTGHVKVFMIYTVD